jgi:hypothetical protein
MELFQKKKQKKPKKKQTNRGRKRYAGNDCWELGAEFGESGANWENVLLRLDVWWKQDLCGVDYEAMVIRWGACF